MKFREIFRFEIAHRLRRASTWLCLALMLGLAWLVANGLLVQEAQGSGNTGAAIHVNAPFFIAFASVFYSMLGMVVTAALFSDAAMRDAQARMSPLFFTAPIRKADYLGGRFLGALLLNTLLVGVGPLGFMLGTQLSGLEPEFVGPFRIGAYFGPYLTILLPNLFVTAAIFFTVAAFSRRALASYATGVLLFIGSLIAAEALGARSAYREVAAYLEPFGFMALDVQSEYWTPFERNTRLVGLSGVLLWNRVIWTTFALSVLTFLYVRFRFAQDGERVRRRSPRRTRSVEPLPERTAPVTVPHARQSFAFVARVHQVLAVARRSFGEIFANRYLLFIVASTLILLFITGWDAQVVMDTPTWPVTYVIAREVIGQIRPLIYLLIVIFAGEVVWRERDARTSEMTDATPIPNWVSLVGKFGALVLATIALQGVLMVGGMLLQALQGYYNFEPGIYVRILFGMQLIDYLLWAALAMFIHVLVDQKYVGHLVFALYFAFSLFGRLRLGIEHNLLLYPGDPGWTYSDLSGFGPSLVPFLWFKLYWAAWALLLTVGANLLWRRGRESGLQYRLREVAARLTRPAAISAALAVLLVLATGGFVFYNTNVLNDYRGRDARIARAVEYERLYKRYEDVPQPRVVGSNLRVEVFPEQRTVSVSGSYVLSNRSAGAIDSLHVMIDPDVQVRAISFGRKARRVLQDDFYGYRLFALDEALRPGDSLRMAFDLTFRPRGFTNWGGSMAVAENGTYFDQDLLPSLGYRADLELQSESVRREHGLAPRIPSPSPLTEEAKWRSPRNTEWFHADVVIGTAADQIALAPGSLRRTWTENGRRYFHYVSDAPIKDVFAFFSADYAVREDRWKDVQIQIFHHPTHTENLDRMIRGVKASLDYYTEHFGSYPYSQFWIAEVPRYHGNFARALPNSVAYSEGFGFIARVEDGIDYPFAVTAHEVAHQWWGGQIAPADAQGSRVLYETLAHYSAMMVMEKTYGPDQVRRFLGQFRHRYLVGRQNDGQGEVPLLLSGDHKYIHYDKGAVVMYALRDYIGEERVNTALRRLLEKYRFGGPPYPTTLDLYRNLQAVTPDSLHYLLTDLFEEITIWDMQTKVARVEPTGAGAYRVTLEVEAQKMEADSIGRAVQVPMDDFVEVGVFAAAEDGEELGEPLYLRKHRIHSGEQTITVTVPRAPARAGIDPYHRLIEWKREDNARDVVPGKGSDPPGGASGM